MDAINRHIRLDLQSYLSLFEESNVERTEIKGDVYIDRHENPNNFPNNRCFSEDEAELLRSVSKYFQQPEENILFGQGIDGLFDLILRATCAPHHDSIAIVLPVGNNVLNVTRLNHVEVRNVMTDDTFELQPKEILQVISKSTKIVYFDQPGIPTGRLHSLEKIKEVLDHYEGLVVINESSLPFCQQPSLRAAINRYPNLIVLQSLAGYWASDALGLAFAFLNKDLAKALRNINHLFPQPLTTFRQANEFLNKQGFDANKWRINILEERAKVMGAFAQMPIVLKVFPSATNFFLATFSDAESIHRFLLEQGIHTELVKSSHPLCQNCICFTIGLPHENTRLISALRNYKP